MTQQLLTTKFYIPHAPGARVARPHLCRKLTAGLEQSARLALVCAPAGFGKSTLISIWVETLAAPVAWLSLDAQDNDPLRFLTYLTAAIQRACPGVGIDVLAQLQSTPAPAHERLLTSLLNALGEARHSLVVVLDDYHVITQPAIHENLTFLVEHLPEGILLILATRVLPPLPLARWRARRQLVEVRLQDLRFTADETACLLNDLYALALDTQDLETLAARTEGWAAGLQLAALALQSENDRHTFLQHFGGTQHFIADYLVEEVLKQLSPAVTETLLHLSILERFCGPLCVAVTGDPESENQLQELFARNVFLIPLDAERYWFRFHSLFADLLYTRLKKRNSDLLLQLYSRASTWCAANDLPAEALRYALEARDFDAAARLVNANWVSLLHQGQVETTLRWLDALPSAVFEDYPGLSNAYAWARFMQGQTEAVEPHLQHSERVLAALTAAGRMAETDTEYQQARAATASLRAFVHYARRELDIAYEQGQSARVFVRQAGDLLEGNLYIILGQICRELGHLDEAIQYYRVGIPLAWHGGNAIGVLIAYAALSRLYRQQQQWSMAEQTCQEARAFLDTHHLTRIPAAGILYLEQAYLLLARQHTKEAHAALDTALDVGRSSGMADLIAACETLRDQLPPPALTNLPDPLTARELEVLTLLADGLSNREIAAALVITLATVKKHTSNILSKLMARSRTQAVAYARQLGLL